MLKMTTVLYTTDTPSHRAFAWQVSQVRPFDAIVYEPATDRDPWLEFIDEDKQLRGASCLFSAEKVMLTRDITKVCVPCTTAILYGTRNASPRLVQSATYCVTIHDGDPHNHRGLDGHLWALADPLPPDLVARLVVSLLKTDPERDCGVVLADRELEPAGWPFEAVRAYATRAAVSLVDSFLLQPGLRYQANFAKLPNGISRGRFPREHLDQARAGFARWSQS